MSLTATAVKHAKPKDKPYKLADGQGMYLLVNPNGTKYWRLKYRFGGKEKSLALGVYPIISLTAARDMRGEAKQLLAKNVDPGLTKRLKKQARTLESENCFKAIATEWFETKMVGLSEGYRTRTLRMLEHDLYPSLGARPINQITAAELLMTLRKIEARGAIDMAHRAKQRAGQVFRFAVSTGRAERDPSADLSEALTVAKKTHFAAITEPKEVGDLLVAIDGYDGTPVVKAALQISALLFQRPGEIRAMEWTEIKWDENRWELPAEKTKSDNPHIVPLCNQAVDLLEELQQLTGRGRYVFPSARGASRSLSENGVRVALRTMGYDKNTMTAHGFRAMARTILDEVLGYRVDWIEHQLAHAVKDTNGRAYNRTAHLPQRREMMQGWADYLDNLKAQALSGNVITAKFGR